MDEIEKTSNVDKTNESPNTENITLPEKPYVIRNFKKELKRVRWPLEKKHNKSFFYIFLFIIFLTGFFALISLGATELIELMGAK
ncbi:MAG: preprotein translocase subunit SecE [Metamycoplasmataceae bacterium]